MCHIYIIYVTHTYIYVTLLLNIYIYIYIIAMYIYPYKSHNLDGVGDWRLGSVNTKWGGKNMQGKFCKYTAIVHILTEYSLHKNKFDIKFSEHSLFPETITIILVINVWVNDTLIWNIYTNQQRNHSKMFRKCNKGFVV